MAKPRLTPWARTTIGTTQVAISIDSDTKLYAWAEQRAPNYWRIGICPSLLHPTNKALLLDALVHEITHVIEGTSARADLDPRTVKGCSRLAQTMGGKMALALLNMRLAADGVENPIRALL